MRFNKINYQIGNFLKSSRIKNNLTRSIVALKLGVDVEFVVNIEDGKQSFSSKILNKVLEAYKIEYLEFNSFFNKHYIG